MRHLESSVYAACLFVSACGGKMLDAGTGGVASAGGSDGGALTSTGSDGGSASADGGGAGVQLYVLPEFNLDAGEEKILCSYFPPDGLEHYIHSFDIDISPGSHHLIAFRVTDDGGHPARGPEVCNLPFETGYVVDGMLPGAQQLHAEIDLPAGVGMELGKKDGIYFQSHYINATNSPITAHVQYQMTLMDPSAVAQQAGVLFYSDTSLDVPVGLSTTQLTCKAPQAMSFVYMTGHMHEHATRFFSTVNGTTLFETMSWDDAGAGLYPGVGFPVHEGDTIQFSCDYDNMTGADLFYGDSAVKNEMCILSGIFYPVVAEQTLYNCDM